MVAVTKIGSIVKNLVKLSKASAPEDKTMFSLFKQLVDGSGKPSPITYEGKYLDELPEMFKPLLQGLKKPKVIIGAKSSNKGSGILGFAVKDGNKTTSKFAIGIDETRGELPIIQVRGSYGINGDRALGMNVVHNPNVTLNPKTCNIFSAKRNGGTNLSSQYRDENMQPAFLLDTYLNKELAKKIGLPKELIANLDKSTKIKPKNINELSSSIRELFTKKGSKIYSINDCTEDILQIAQWKGKPNQETITKAKDILTKKMGYPSEKIKITLRNEGGEAMSFDHLTGELTVSPEFLKTATHQDVAVILSHELTHLEDFLKLYKKLGAEKFEKLVRPAKLVQKDTRELNHNWYQEISKDVEANWKRKSGLQKTTITGKDGEILEVIDHQAFNGNSIKKEFQEKLKLEQANYKGKFSELKQDEMYQFSPTEQHARLTEQNIIYALKEKGILQQTEFLADYGKGPFAYLGNYKSRLAPIEKQLEKYGSKKAEKFNELYYKELEYQDKRLAELCKKLDVEGGLPTKEFEEMQKIITDKFGSIKTMEARILSNIETRLGIKPETFNI